MPDLTLVSRIPIKRVMGGEGKRVGYWRANLRALATLLSVWFAVSFGLGILLVEPLNRFHIGGFPLGFWFAQQGSIYVFIVLVWIYARWMDRIERDFIERDPIEPGRGVD